MTFKFLKPGIIILIHKSMQVIIHNFLWRLVFIFFSISKLSTLDCVALLPPLRPSMLLGLFRLKRMSWPPNWCMDGYICLVGGIRSWGATNHYLGQNPAVKDYYSASSVIRTSIIWTLVYPNSQKLKFHEFHYNLQDGGHLVMWSVFQLPVCYLFSLH